ncbi:MAG: glycoside hydrolase family 88 protein [Anaerolineales bacterium]
MQRGTKNNMVETNNALWSLQMAASALRRYAPAKSKWHYTDGLLFKAIHGLSEQTDQERYRKHVLDYLDLHVTKSGDIRTYRLDEYNLDQINPGKLLFPAHRLTGAEKYRRALELLRDQLRSHPRTKQGAYWHKAIYPYQTWLDGIYMALPFLAEYASSFGEDATFDDVVFQIKDIESKTRDEQTGLLFHAYDESRQQRWAEQDTGRSPNFWSRAIGWYVMAIVDVLDFLPGEQQRRDLVVILERTLKAISRVQDEETGLWWQVLNQGDRPGNYFEASGTAMFVYSMAKGVRLRYLDKQWLPVARRGFDGILKHLITVNDSGLLDLHGVCAGAGLGGEPYRDGSFEYYVSEPVVNNDLHGVGAFLLAAIEIEFAKLKKN